MKITRRRALSLTASAGAVLLSKQSAFAQSGTNVVTGIPFFIGQNEIVIHPVNHASLVLSINSNIIYVDPVGSMDRYTSFPEADLILITHHHSDHFDNNLLTSLTNDSTPLIVNSVVNSRLPDALKSNTTTLKNGETTANFNIQFSAIPAYNITHDRKQYHPKGRDNGYVLNFDGVKIYIAGDTEDIPEMRALTDIDVAFVPMNLPFTMDVEQATSAVLEFAPKNVYPYHYGTSNILDFKGSVEAANQDITVQLYNWYN